MFGAAEALAPAMKVKRAAKYGFCSGVRIADLKVKRFAAGGGRGAILGQVVHNERVVEEMERLGVRTVDEIAAVEEPTIVFSAHGVPPSFHDARARARAADPRHDLQVRLRHPSRVEAGARRRATTWSSSATRSTARSSATRNDLDPATYHIVSTIDEAESIDWSPYQKIKIFYQTTLNAEEFEDVVQTIERRAARRRARRHDLLRHEGKPGRGARARAAIPRST